MLFNLLRLILYRNIIDESIPGRRFNKPQKNIDRCTFTRTILSEKSKYFSFLYFQIKSVKGGEIVVFFM